MKIFQVMGRNAAANFQSDGRPWACISIGTGNGDWPKITKVNQLGCLQLFFADADTKSLAFEEAAKQMDSCLFSEKHAHQILDFVNEVWDKVDYFLIHCTAGQSRSPAVAAAITKIKGEDNKIWWSIKTPNALVYSTLLNVAHERGEYGPVEETPAGEGRFHY